MKKNAEIEAVYVHTPFCVQKCLYCDFASYACHDVKMMERYTDALCQEIATGGAVHLPVAEQATIYFGGGTPSTLPTDCIARIVVALKDYGYWRHPAEATIEVNPGTADLAKLKALRSLGFDRISFGIQSLNNQELKTIGRIHTAEEALQALELAKEGGFSRISGDLIYALPGQTLASLKQTLARLTATGIEHLSVYGLILEEETPLSYLVEQGRLSLPDEDLAADMYELVQSYLKEQGFQRYEISNYAKGEEYSRHNMVYWRYQPYAAFGAAACGFDGQCRYTAPTKVADYIEQAPQVDYQIEQLTRAELLGEYMFMGLRKTEGVSLTEAQERFQVDILQRFAQELEPYLRQGLLIHDEAGQRLYLSETGMEVGNWIFEIFVTV